MACRTLAPLRHESMWRFSDSFAFASNSLSHNGQWTHSTMTSEEIEAASFESFMVASFGGVLFFSPCCGCDMFSFGCSKHFMTSICFDSVCAVRLTPTIDDVGPRSELTTGDSSLVICPE